MFPLIVVLGSLLRFLNFFNDRSFWGDEFFTIFLVTQPFKNVLLGALRDVHPPLYAISYYVAVKLLGVHEWSFRLHSCVFSIGIILAVYYLSKTFFEKKIALLAAFLTAISPYFIQLADEVRGYNLFAVAASGTIVFFAKLLRNPLDTKWVFLYILAASATIYSQHYGWFVLLATTVTIVWLWCYEKRPDWNVLWAQGTLFISVIPAFVLMGYQAFRFESAHLYHERMIGYATFPILLKKIVGLFWHFSAGYVYSMITVEEIIRHLKSSPLFWVSGFTTLACLFLMGRGLAALYRTAKKVFVLFLMLLLFPIFFIFFIYAIRLDARYMSFAAPVFMILISIGLFSLKSRRIRLAWASLIIFTSLLGTFKTIAMPTDPIHKEDYKGCLRYVLRQAEAEDVICGYGEAMRFYEPRLGIPRRAEYRVNIHELTLESAQRFRRLWYLDVLNMHPNVRHEQAKAATDYIESLGFVLSGPPIQFGGKEGTAFAFVFENKLNKNRK